MGLWRERSHRHCRSSKTAPDIINWLYLVQRHGTVCAGDELKEVLDGRWGRLESGFYVVFVGILVSGFYKGMEILDNFRA